MFRVSITQEMCRRRRDRAFFTSRRMRPLIWGLAGWRDRASRGLVWQQRLQTTGNQPSSSCFCWRLSFSSSYSTTLQRHGVFVEHRHNPLLSHSPPPPSLSPSFPAHFSAFVDSSSFGRQVFHFHASRANFGVPWHRVVVVVPFKASGIL